ncbi:MAG TPA: response regulator [Pyrinomonadaceae bacterium]|nr:response regulator [Pyrinomonadaceae bacterium]
MTISHINSQSAHGRRRAPRVLVTDDDDDTRSLFSTILQINGCVVLEAADGEEAVRLAESSRPDLILMDGSLPHLDGLAATRRIRQLVHIGRVPIIFVSGHAEPDFRARAREAGCDDFLVKPFGLAELGGVLEKYLGHDAEAFAV